MVCELRQQSFFLNPKWRLRQPVSPKDISFYILLAYKILSSVRCMTLEMKQATKCLPLLPSIPARGKTFTSLDNCMPMAYSCCPNKCSFTISVLGPVHYYKTFDFINVFMKFPTDLQSSQHYIWCIRASSFNILINNSRHLVFYILDLYFSDFCRPSFPMIFPLLH